jgi:integrase
LTTHSHFRSDFRISELCGLTRQDIGFEDEVIHVNHQLLYNKAIGYYIETPKTKSCVRDVPMNEEVKQALKRIMAERKKNYTVTFSNLTKKYNKYHEDSLPKITPISCVIHSAQDWQTGI